VATTRRFSKTLLKIETKTKTLGLGSKTQDETKTFNCLKVRDRKQDQDTIGFKTQDETKSVNFLQSSRPRTRFVFHFVTAYKTSKYLKYITSKKIISSFTYSTAINYYSIELS
jgi:hypothetical protein